MKIILDQYKVYQPGKNTLSVISELDYIKSRKSLLTYFTSDNKDFDSIYVSARPYIEWFNDLPELLQIVSPISLLTEKFPAIPIADDLTNDDVIQLNLLDAAIEPTEKDIIKNVLNIVLPERIENSQLYRYAFMLSETVITNKRFFSNNYISVTWQKKLNQALANQSSDARRFFQPVIELDESYCHLLAKGMYGLNSNFYRKYWLDDASLEFLQLSIPLPFIEKFIFGPHPKLPFNEKYEVVMERFFEQNLASGAMGINDLSGHYGAEINALLSIGKKVDEITKDELVVKFKTVLSDKQSTALNKLIIPKLQEFPDVSGLTVKHQAEKLKQWAIDTFIPYKFYYDEASSPDNKALELIDLNAGKFGDWFFDNLDAILKDDDIYTNIDVVKNIKEQTKDQSNLIWLVLMVLQPNTPVIWKRSLNQKV